MPAPAFQRRSIFTLAAALLAAASPLPALAAPEPAVITNVSYDPTRELYQALNPAFAAYWKKKTGQDVSFRMSHGGSAAQSRAIIDGLDADVATLALGYDIDALATQAHLLAPNWQQALPQHSSPYVSTIVFLVRKGNPKGIHDWGDLIKPGIQVITANPKTSGGARWNFLAAWAYGRKAGHSEAAARDYVTKLYAHAPVLDSGSRGATTTFVERGIGDVLLAWENEAFLAVNKLGKGEFQIIVPSISIRAEPPVAVITRNAEKHGVTAVAKAYLEFLYTPQAQAIIARNYYRPANPAAAAAYAHQFPHLAITTIDHDFGGWRKAQATYFADDGVFDQITANR